MSGTDPEKNPGGRTFSARIVTIVCGVLLGIHLWLRFSNRNTKDGLDAIALGLVVVGLSPWIALIVKTLKFGGIELSFQDVQTQVKRQGAEIEQLKFLISHFLPVWEIEHMRNLLGNKPFYMDLDRLPAGFEGELRHLRYLRFIDNVVPGRGTTETLQGLPRKRDLREDFKVTDAGQRYLKYLEEVQPAEEASEMKSKDRPLT